MLIILKISTAKQLNTKYIFPEERLSQQPFRSTLPCSIKLSRAFVKSFYIIPVIEAKLRKTSFCFSFTYTHDPIPALKLTPDPPTTHFRSVDKQIFNFTATA